MKLNILENDSFDFEGSIQISRILKILSDLIQKLEVALCLPLVLANDCDILHKFFPEDQIRFIKETCKNVSKEKDKEPPYEADDMCLAIDLLLNVPQFNDFCRTNLTEAISPGGTTLLRNLEELRVCMNERLKVTPQMEAQKDQELRRLYQQNIRNRDEVEKLTEKLNKLTAETEQEINEKKQLIIQQIETIGKINKGCRDKMKKKMDEAERQICWDIKNSEYRLDELQTGAKNAEYQREIQLKDHLNTESDLRMKRYRFESQLVVLLQKYDSDIGERQALLEELTANYEREREEIARLQKQFDEQELEYVNLMMEKEQYERQEWETKLYNIRCRIAARKIQRYYRAYLAATKTKGKKGKKGKKKK